jgi:hypothetical protein
MSRCKPGDLAVVIEAANHANIGRIVKVVALHDGKGPLGAIGPRPVWMVKAPTRLTWTDGPKRYRRKNGPVPDSQLQPIRGVNMHDASSDMVDVKEKFNLNSDNSSTHGTVVTLVKRDARAAQGEQR